MGHVSSAQPVTMSEHIEQVEQVGLFHLPHRRDRSMREMEQAIYAARQKMLRAFAECYDAHIAWRGGPRAELDFGLAMRVVGASTDDVGLVCVGWGKEAD